MTTYTCTKCGEVKAADDFGPQRRECTKKAPNGRVVISSWCHACKAAAKRAWYLRVKTAKRLASKK